MQIEMDCHKTRLKEENYFEEIKPITTVYLFPVKEEQLEDTVMVDPLAGCEEWNEVPRAGSLLLGVKKEEVETETEEDAGISNQRSEQVAFEEMKENGDDASGSNKSVSLPARDEREASQLENKYAHPNRQLLMYVHSSETTRYKKTLNAHREEPQLSTSTKEFKYRNELERHLRVHTEDKPYVCDHCGKGFTQMSNLEVHRRNHTGEKPYNCSNCNKRFASKSSLVAHTRCHMNMKSNECKEYRKTCERSLHNAPARVHGRNFYKCNVCSKTFARKGTLNIHMFTHNREWSQMTECQVCGNSFQARSMKSHILTHTGEKPYKCRFCEATFAHRTGRIRHEEKHSGRNVVQCKECGKSFLAPQYLKIHMRCHTGEKPYKCSVCSKTFAQKGPLNSHMFTHDRERTQMTECQVCGNSFKTKSMITHMRTHSDKKPYKCRFCQTKFAKSSNRLTHEKMHLERKAVQCHECGKSFLSTKYLKTHMRCHTGEKRYKCSVCSSTFSQKKHLNRHMFIHSHDQKQLPEREVSGDSSTAINMITHMRTLAGEKPYICRFCDAAFADSSNRLRHEDTHADRKAVQCKECGKRFVSTKFLELHMRHHTGEKPQKCGK